MRYRVEISGHESKTEGFYEAEAQMVYGGRRIARGQGQARSSIRAARFALEDLSAQLRVLEGQTVPGCEETADLEPIPSDGECS